MGVGTRGREIRQKVQLDICRYVREPECTAISRRASQCRELRNLSAATGYNPGMSNSWGRATQARICSIVFILAGIVLMSLPVRETFIWYRSADWPVVDGLVVRSEMRRRTRGGQKAVVEYEYQVGGERYHGHRMWYHGSDWSRLQDFPKGQLVVVHYWPTWPSVAVVKSASGPSKLSLFAIFAFGAVIIFAGYKIRKESSEAEDAV